MRVRRLGRWQWMAVGVVLGVGVGWARLAVGGAAAGEGAAVGMGQAEFERLLVAAPAMGRYPALDDVTVVPVDDVYWVRALRRFPLADGGASSTGHSGWRCAGGRIGR